MGIRIGALLERLRSSLFFVPMLFVAVFAGLGLATTEVDSLFDGADDLPFVLTSTVDSARELLSVVAAATITVAGIAFSVSLLVMLVDLAFDEIRRTAAPLPTVCTDLLEALHLLHESALEVGRPALALHLRGQADLVLAGAQHADLLPADRDVVRAAHERRFGGAGPTS